jgi:TonB-linked SusC/RagA family outer membrane protein
MKKTILLFSLFVMSTTLLFAQKMSVNGKVSDSSGGALPGVSILIQGTNNGTSTDFDGNYTINAAKGDVLVFSFLGFKTKNVTVTGTNINVSLNEDTSQLDEVVITAFGIKKEAKSLGYAVQQVNVKDLSLAGKTNGLEALQGQVAGLRINRTSGSAGGGVDMIIRGVTSVDPSRDNQPLIVVDGMTLNNDTFSGNVLPSAGSNAVNSSEQFGFSNRAADINPEDIESYSVLKGAAAAALYGIEASNGAIIITTKKGKKGKAKIRLSSSTTFRDIVTTPELQTKFREGHRTSRRPGVTIDPTSPDGYNRYSWAFYSWGVPFSDDSFEQSDGTITDLSNDKFYSPYDLFKTGMNTQLNVNISGANDKFNYFLSLGNNSDSGVLPNTDYQKKNLRFNGGLKVKDNLKITSSVAFTNSGGSRANGGDKSVFSSLSYWSSTFPINDYLTKDGKQKNYTPGWIDNPRYFLETSNLKDNVNRWVGVVSASWDPYKWMNINYSYQIDNYSDQRNRFVPNDLDVGTQVGGFILEEVINYTGLESNLLITFNKDFTEDFNATLLVGESTKDTKLVNLYARGEGLNIPSINDLSNTTNKFSGKGVSQIRKIGVFGDLRLSYKDQLYLSITNRNDWLSDLPAENRSFFYPSVSTSWVFSEILDMKEFLSFGKIRASWAQVGKGPGAGKVGHFYYPDASFPFSGAGGYYSGTTFGDLNMKPEKLDSYEIGFDLRFFKNKFSIDYSYYKGVVNNQIFKVGSAYSSSLSGYIRNAGSYETWGHELLLGAKLINKDDFKWRTSFNFSTNTGKVTDLPNDLEEIVFFDDYITNKAKEGDPLGTLYGWKFKTVNGQRYVNSDGKWVVTGSENDDYFYQGANQKVIVGNAFPDFVTNFSNHLNYKGFGFDFLLEWKKGGDIYDKGFRNAIRNGNLKETEFRDETKVLDGLMDDGSGGYIENTQELMINADGYYRSASNYNVAAETILQDGSWLKLRSIGFSYNFGKEIVQKIKLDDLSVSFNANNILLWTPFKGYDPEGNYFSAGSNIYGYNGLSVPLSRGYSLGINVQF